MFMKGKSKSPTFEAELLASSKEWAIVLLLALCVGIFTLFLEYRDFLALKQENKARIRAEVVLQYPKSDERGVRTVLKLKTARGVSFYTTSREPLRDLLFRTLLVRIDTSKLTFYRYLKGGFYAYATDMILLKERDKRMYIRNLIDAQHNCALAGSFYRTLFLADSLAKPLRDGAAKLGISHLLAISGFHLGVLSLVLWGIFYPIYRAFHRRFFPYRNAYFDLGAIVLLILAGYLVILGESPSFLRAFAMALWGYFLLHRGVRILSFSSLALVGIALIALFPRLVFSIGFFLSMMGVFLIFLHIHHTRHWRAIPNFFALNIALYFYMLIPAHLFFDTFALEQLFSPFLTMLFTLFYPLSLVLHFLGLGFLGDSYILAGILGEYQSVKLNASYFWAIPYFILALLSVQSARAYWLLGAWSLLFFLSGVYLFL